MFFSRYHNMRQILRESKAIVRAQYRRYGRYGRDDHKDIPGNPSTAKTSQIKLNDRSDGKPLRVLSEQDWNCWTQNGFVVVKNAVPAENVERLVSLMWEFEEKDAIDRDTWYAPDRAVMRMTELVNSGMVELYNHQYLWDNRQHLRVYEAFVDVWGTEKLWVTIDRCNLCVPVRPGFEFTGFIHWDYDPESRPQNVQGVLALNDQTEDCLGGFQCVPQLYRDYDRWKLSQPADRDRFKPDITDLEVVKVKLNASDLLIFNSLLPHGIKPNTSGNRVRLAQYISMMPAEESNEELRKWRIMSWNDRRSPEGYAFPGDPRNWEQTRYERATLSALGQRLLGLKDWFT